VKPIKPRAVRAGATLGIVSPASAAKPELVSAGMAALEQLGYRTKLFPHALSRGPLYYAGTAEDRAADLHAAFEDPDVDAILCTRGGWGVAELLPLLRPDLVRANAKPFLGYSDPTTLHLWLRNEVGLVSFQGPMVAADFSKGRDAGHGDQGSGCPGVDLPSWRNALEGVADWQVGPAEGLRVLRPGLAEGELSGGCLAIYAESLGTPWAARPRGGVLMLEDINVKPYQWDRMLVHLRHAGLLEGIRGIVFGDMTQSCAAEEVPAIEASLLHALRDFAGPIAIGLRSGHVDAGNVTLPLGVQVRLDLTDEAQPSLRFLESAAMA
jgi:muramoyltetrapeptide carboxypeptidase